MLQCPYLHTAKEQLVLEAEKHFQMEEISKKESKSSYSKTTAPSRLLYNMYTHIEFTFSKDIDGTWKSNPIQKVHSRHVLQL